MIAIRQPPRVHYIQNEIYSNYSNVNGKEHYAEIQKTNNDGRVRITKNINGNKMEYYVLPPSTFSDNIVVKPYSLNRHKRRHIRTKIKKSKRLASSAPNKKDKNKSVKKQRQLKNL
jgi:hypothetical protein